MCVFCYCVCNTCAKEAIMVVNYMGVKFYSQNVRGLNNKIKRRMVFKNFRRLKADIICLQETYCTNENERFWSAEWGARAFYANGTSNSRGVAVLFRKNSSIKVLNVDKDENGRFLIITIKLYGKEIVISNIYAPNEDCPEFFSTLIRHLNRASSPEWLIGGDFNLVLNAILDRKTFAVNRSHKRAHEMLSSIMKEFELCDIWRHFNPEVKRYTCHKSVNCASRIDFFLLTSTLVSRVERVDIIPSATSDHSILFLDISMEEEKRGRGLWRLNTRWLQNDDYKKLIQDSIDQVVIKNAKENLDPLMNWEMIKNEITGQTIKFSYQQAKVKNQEIGDLENKIASAQNSIDELPLNDPRTKNLNCELKRNKLELEKILLEKAKHTILKTKAKWFNEGEQSTKYFLNMQKQRCNERTINKIYLDDGSLTTERNKIAAEFKKFYEVLYTSNPDVCFTHSNHNVERMLSEMEKKKLEEPLTQEELTHSLNSMANNKTPGNDGLPPEFYKIFWDKLVIHFVRLVKACKELAKLHISARRGVICLLPKKDRDPLHVKNWRPIVLLNTDYKIIAKALANRIKPLLSGLISEDQTGFMQGRNISTNTRKIMDISQYCIDEEIDSILLVVDFEKCFDSVELSSVDKILGYFNFGSNFRDYIKLLFNQFSLSILSNGYTSEEFGVSRGLLQGNPIASFLYLLTGQILNDRIMMNQDIKGVRINNKEVKSIQFADDLNMPLMFDQKSLSATIQELKLFKQQVGLHINLEKSKIIRMGAIRNSTCLLDSQGIPWSNEMVQILGINITNDKQLEKVNIDPVVDKMNTVCNAWKARDLSLVGKVLIINTLVMSLLVYRMAVIPLLSEQMVKKIKKIWSEFIWGKNKRPKIAWQVLTAKKENGGLNLSDIIYRDMSLKVQWVQRYFQDSIVKELADKILKNPIGDWLWKANLKIQDVKFFTTKKGFWSDVLKAWCQFNFQAVCNQEMLLEQFLWFNSEIRRNNKPYFSTNLYCNGILNMSDILNADLSFKSIAQVRAMSTQIDILEYMSLVQNIPQHWKRLLRRDTNIQVPIPRYQLLDKYQSIVRIAYTCMNNRTFVTDAKRNRWEVKFDIELWPEQFAKIYKAIWSITNNSKLRSFQYRLLMHALVTNVQLFRWKLTSSARCTFCNLTDETEKHLLFECPKVQPLWRKVASWLATIENRTINLNAKEVIFNNVNTAPKHVTNTIVLVTKFNIYRARCMKVPVSVFNLREDIVLYYKMEFLGALVKNKVLKCNEKWQGVLAIIEN